MTSSAPTAPPARHDRPVVLVVAALAGLLLVAGLVLRGTLGLSAGGDPRIVTIDKRTGAVTSPGVELRPSGQSPLFDRAQLAPGDVVRGCLDIEHRGTVALDSVLFSLVGTSGAPAALEALQVTVERGASEARGCQGFRPQRVVASGKAADLIAATGGNGWPSWTPTDQERATYRISVMLDSDVPLAAQGETVTTDFVWAATADPVGADLASRMWLLALALARDAVLPLLILIFLAVLFLGIQDRIDRRDPKLALAAVSQEPAYFMPARDLLAGLPRARPATPRVAPGDPR